MPSYVVAGASRGIGFEFARQLSLGAGNDVFAIVRQNATAAGLLELSKQAQNLHVVEADLADYNAIKAAAETVGKTTGGTLDYLIYNAAFVDQAANFYSLDTYPDEGALERDIDQSIKVNVMGVIHAINAFLPLLRKGSVRKVIALSTGLADCDVVVRTGHAVLAPYSISKAALNMAIAKYAARFKDDGFTFLALSPGVVNTRPESDGPPPKEFIEVFIKMVKGFQKVAPDWDGIPISPDQSVKMMLDVINKVTVEDSGEFLSHFGNKTFM